MPKKPPQIEHVKWVGQYAYFNTGYPFIGMAQENFDAIKDAIQDQHPGFSCSNSIS